MPKRRTVDEDSEIGSNVGDDEGDEFAEAEDLEPTKPKKQRRGAAAFIDDIADVEDEDEEEEDDDEDDELDEYEEDDGAEAVEVRKAEAMNRQLDAQRRKEENQKLEAQVRERYEGAGARPVYAEDMESADTRFRELPDASRDPKLWLMRCKPNQEKMLVISLMQKYLDSMHTDKPLQIKSAMCTDVKGYIYIEAYKEVHVREATQGLNHLFYRIQQVPNNEMTDVMRVRVASGKRPLVRGSWCRMKRNDEYKDDLCQVRRPPATRHPPLRPPASPPLRQPPSLPGTPPRADAHTRRWSASTTMAAARWCG